MSSSSSSRPPITCHILDTVKGKPAKGVSCRLSRQNQTLAATSDGSYSPIASGFTNDDGRVASWEYTQAYSDFKLTKGIYRIKFEILDYMVATHGDPTSKESASFFPFVEINFIVDDPSQHYHIPLLLSPFGYTTYRGS